MKPCVFIDLARRGEPRRRGLARLDLRNERVIYIPLSLWGRRLFIAFALISFFASFVAAPTGGISVAAGNDAERRELEAQLAELEGQISDYEKTISQYRKQGSTLQSEIKRLEAQVAKVNLQIKAVNLSLSRLDREIVTTQSQIGETERTLVADRANLTRIIQSLYENDRETLVEVLLKNPQLSDFFADMNHLLAVQDNVRVMIGKITENRRRLVDQKEVLALEREDAVALKTYQAAQRATISKTQSEKATLLKVTKGKESEYQKLLAETKKTAAQIRQQIFKLLGGGELSFEAAFELAKFAEQATGVRAALVLAVLDRESALGKNVGRCSYKTAMHPARDKPIFLEITKELGLNPEATLVSCANSDGVYGGAMGPAQFIPSTWEIYKDKIASMTGNNPPSPWRNTDAFMATALYLKDAGAHAGASITEERQAAARYYAGNRWRSYLWTYGERVIAHAKSFQDDIDILGG
ncbi:lytic murein transglycosylase [Candidatus Wolfebacteria bacterium]|nr:lytic murein transglycosylase [Candidatus Wolfebacteria bacterium]